MLDRVERLLKELRRELHGKLWNALTEEWWRGSLVPLKTHTFFYNSPVAPKQRPWRAPLSRTVPTDLLGSPWQPHRS